MAFMNIWSQLRPLYKLDQLAETIMKTAFFLSENHHVIQSYLNYKGAHFKVINRVGESEFEILCRQINIEKTNYAIITKSDSKNFVERYAFDKMINTL